MRSARIRLWMMRAREQEYTGVRAEVPESSTANQKRPPISSGSQPLHCATNQKPVCCVDMGRALEYCTPSTVQSFCFQRYGVSLLPAPMSLVMSKGVPS